MVQKPNARILVLAVVAMLLVAVTIYDYTRRPGEKNEPGPLAMESEKAATIAVSRITQLSREAVELDYFIAHANQVRERYQSIAAPYAESVATFVTLYSAGESISDIVRQRIPQLLPKGVEIKELMIAEANPDGKGATALTATLVLNGSDSKAFEDSLLVLGNAANGMVWKTLNVVANKEQRTLRASGQLSLLMVEQAE
jgi:hypothetical protein